MVAENGSYVTHAAVKNHLHITKTDHDDIINLCIDHAEALMNLSFSDFTGTLPYTAANAQEVAQLEMIACDLAGSRYLRNYADVNQRNQVRGEQMRRDGLDMLKAFCKTKWGGRHNVSLVPKITKLEPEEDTAMDLNIFSNPYTRSVGR